MGNCPVKFSDHDARVRSQFVFPMFHRKHLRSLYLLHFLSDLEISYLQQCLLQSDRLIRIMFTFPVHRAYVYGHKLLTVLTLKSVLALCKTLTLNELQK